MADYGNAPTNPDSRHSHVRDSVFATTPESLGISVGPNDPYGILMETGFDGGVSSLICMGPNWAGIYFSTGGETVAQPGDQRVLQAGLAFQNMAAQYVHYLRPDPEHPMPDPQRVRFTIFTRFHGYTYEAAESELGLDRDVLSPLFRAGHAVIAELRAIASRPAAAPLPQAANASGFIRIVGVPPGEAPLQVREQWVGLVLPLMRDNAKLSIGSGVLTLGLSLSKGYVVDSYTAVQILEFKSPEAARWWREHVPMTRQPGRPFLFRASACERVDG